jgi:hypothetical protein
MKHLRVVVLLIVCLLLWGCQGGKAATVVPIEPAPAAAPLSSKISISGDPGAAIDCKTGQALTSPAPAAIGLGGASLEHVGDQAVVTFNFPHAEDLPATLANDNVPYFGGISFVDPNLSLPQSNPDWHFDGLGNRGYFWFYNPGSHKFAAYSNIFKNNRWQPGSESEAIIAATGSNLTVSFPWSFVAGSAWYVSGASDSACTALGLGVDGKPNLPIPTGGAPAAIGAPSPMPTLQSKPTSIPVPTLAPKPAPTFEEPGY